MLAQGPDRPASIRRPAGIPGVAGPVPRSYTGAAGTLLLIHAALVLAFWLARRALPPFSQFLAGSTLQTYVIGGILMQGVLILLPTLLVIVLARIPTASVAGGRPRAGSIILGVTIGIPAAVVFQGLNNLLIYVLIKNGIRLPEAISSKSLIDGDILGQPWLLIVLVAVVGVIMPGLVEELMFRGVILASLTSAGATAAALVWQAIAFAIFHADPLFLLPPFLAALMLAAIRRRSGSIWPAALAHMSLNLSLLAINPLLPRLTEQYMNSAASGAVSLLYASLIAACIAAVALVPLLVLINHMPLRDAREGEETGESEPADERAREVQAPLPATGRRQRRPAGFALKRGVAAWRLHFWPADWKYMLAMLALVVTMILETRT
jgi:membrane protease YdiL (CAAX protease family)